MADPVTNNRNLVQPTVGGDNGTWGGILNNGVMAQLDLILGATQPISITAADVTLSIPQWNNAAIRLTGVLTGNHNLILPFNFNSLTVAVGGLFVVDNQTTGAFNVTVITQAAGSTGVIVPQGVRTFLFSDTVNVWYADDSKVNFIPFNGNPNGSVAGTAGSVNSPPSTVWDYTNGVLYFCITTGNAATAVWAAQSPPVTGFNTASNLQFNPTVGANILTVTAVAANTGLAPSAGNPITIPFRSATLANGNPVNRTITSAFAIDTNAVGASFGATGGVPFRLWILALDDTTGLSGKVQLGLMNCSTATQIYAPAEGSLVSSTPMSGTANQPFTIYTEAGVTVTNKPFRYLGYVDFAAGLVTPGTFNIPPTTTQLFGPGIKKPGDVVQTILGSTTIQQNTVGGPTPSNLTAPITLTSSPNLVKAFAAGEISNTSVNSIATAFIMRNNAVQISNLSKQVIASGALPLTQLATSVMMIGLDKPGTVATQTYTVNITASGGTTSFPESGNLATIILEELMG